MSDRSERSYWGFWASFVQSIFALCVAGIFSLIVYIAGAGIFGTAPFRFGSAFPVAAFFILPVVCVIASAFLLWSTNKLGWYLTIVMNLLFEAFFASEFTQSLTPRSHSFHTKGSTLGPHLEVFVHLVGGLVLLHPPIILAIEQLVLLGPPILLALPEVRREYLAPRTIVALTESEQI